MSLETTPWHSRPVQEVAEALGTDPATGLTSAEAEARLAQYGPNELAERPRPGFWQLLLGQFQSFVVIILIVSAVVSILLGEMIEAGAIMAIVVLNAVLGVVQESKAEEALAALKKMAAPDAHVLRNGHRVTIPARELVPGDIVFLEAGNYVPADLRLVESVNLKIDEASLTGESVPVEKVANVTLSEDVSLGDRINCAFMGTTVTYGRGEGIVTATGMQTQMGIIAEMIQSYEPEPTPLQRRLDQLGKWLGWGSLSICGIVFIETLIQDTNISLLINQGLIPYLVQTKQQIIDLFIVAVSLAIAAVPEGLPAVVTICLALGMREMVRRNALIRRLPAVETLGSATVICSDKTGTLTQNEMMAVRLYVANLRLDVSGEGYHPAGKFTNYGEPADPHDNTEIMSLLTGGLLCSDAQLEPLGSDGDGQRYRMVGDPTEGALVVAAAKAGLWREEIEKRLPRVAEVPFDSERKRMSTIHALPAQEGGGYVVYVKGAPDVMLPFCNALLENGADVSLTVGRRQHIENVVRDLGREGLRVLAVAYRRLDELPPEISAETIERDLTLIGLVAMTDPARPEVKPAIDKARRAGIRTVMVTGDYPDTARAIAQEDQERLVALDETRLAPCKGDVHVAVVVHVSRRHALDHAVGRHLFQPPSRGAPVTLPVAEVNLGQFLAWFGLRAMRAAKNVERAIVVQVHEQAPVGAGGIGSAVAGLEFEVALAVAEVDAAARHHVAEVDNVEVAVVVDVAHGAVLKTPDEDLASLGLGRRHQLVNSAFLFLPVSRPIAEEDDDRSAVRGEDEVEFLVLIDIRKHA